MTPLQFEVIDGVYYVGSARGLQADWLRNLQIYPQVEVQTGERRFTGLARVIRAPAEVADLLQLRLQRHPWMIGLIMRLEGLPLRFNRADLERFAARKAFVAIYPQREPDLVAAEA